MTDIIGVLGEASALTGTVTVYTVPSGKAAKIRIIHRITASAAADSTFALIVNGIQIMKTAAMGNSFFQYSNSIAPGVAAAAAAPLGTTAALTVAPAPTEYYLSAGDTVTYTIGGTDLIAASVQVVGSEIDIT